MARILIVDDRASVRGALRSLLERDGHVVGEAGAGLAGVSAVAADAPDLIMLDIHATGLAGWRFLAELRSSGLRERSRVLMARVGADGPEHPRAETAPSAWPDCAVPQAGPGAAGDRLLSTVRAALTLTPDALLRRGDRVTDLARLLRVIDAVEAA